MTELEQQASSGEDPAGYACGSPVPLGRGGDDAAHRNWVPCALTRHRPALKHRATWGEAPFTGLLGPSQFRSDPGACTTPERLLPACRDTAVPSLDSLRGAGSEIARRCEGCDRVASPIRASGPYGAFGAWFWFHPVPAHLPQPGFAASVAESGERGTAGKGWGWGEVGDQVTRRWDLGPAWTGTPHPCPAFPLAHVASRNNHTVAASLRHLRILPYSISCSLYAAAGGGYGDVYGDQTGVHEHRAPSLCSC